MVLLRRFARPDRYPSWLCERIVCRWFVLNWSYNRCARHFEIDCRTVQCICTRFVKGRPLEAPGRKSRTYAHRKLKQEHLAFVLDLIERRSDLYLDEIADELQAVYAVSVSLATLCRELQAAGITA